ncbi:MAG: hypothetical protein KAI61_05270, partial [Alphaproteobacteria bacterium]|nr:hypothetical protein [Alphaproteobacteria bacterium]
TRQAPDFCQPTFTFPAKASVKTGLRLDQDHLPPVHPLEREQYITQKNIVKHSWYFFFSIYDYISTNASTIVLKNDI